MHRRFALMFVAPLLLGWGCQPVDSASSDEQTETAAKATEAEAVTAAPDHASAVTSAEAAHAAENGEGHACEKGAGQCGPGCGQFDEAAAEVLDRKVPADAKWTVLSVTGMHCGGCERRVIANLGNLEGVVGVEADAELGRVRIALAADAPPSVMQSARAKLSELGYHAAESSTR